jgi:hypothetical protein
MNKTETITAAEFNKTKGKKKPVKTSTNDLTKSIVNYLNVKGFVVWRNNNNAIYS